MRSLNASFWLGVALLAARCVCPQSAEVTPDTFSRAVALHQAGDFDGAIREYRAALALDPANFQARSNLGAALAHIGHYEDAIAAYRQALETAPPAGASRLRLNLALAYYKAGQISDASRELEVVRQEVPGDFQATMLLADCYLRLGELQRVIDVLSPVAPAHPGDRGIAYMLGMALIRNGQVEKGQALVDAILSDRDSAEAHFLVGSVAFLAKEYPNAVQEFSKAIAVNPDLPSLQSYYGQALLFTGDPDAAAVAFRQQLASDPNDYASNLRLGQILFRRHQYAEARPLYERALRVHPGSAEAGYEIAALDLAERQPERARLGLEKLVAQWPQYADAHRALAAAAEQLGRTEEATRERALAAPLDSSAGGIPVGSLAPDFTLLAPTGVGRIRLSDFRGKHPVVMILGSYTCPKFRSQADALNTLYERYHDRTEFLLIYIREAHGTGSWQSTINQREGIDLPDASSYEQKREYASACLRKLKIKYHAAVDPLENPTDNAYSAWPSRLYLVDNSGHVAFNSVLDQQNFDARALEQAIQAAVGR